MKTKHGLPEDVVFCKKCVMSNQRPATHPEFIKKTTSDTPTSSFGNDGICDACKYTEYKKTIDWAEREEQLAELCNRFRRNDGRYDVVVPGSGGKDSIFVSHILKHKYNMNPLTVTWAPHAYTDVGLYNMQAWREVGHDNILFTPDPVVHKKLTKLAFLNLVNPFQPFILGQKILAPKLARQFGVELVFYGENQAEIHNKIEETESPIMNIKHFSRESKNSNMFFGGVELNDLKKYGIALKDMQPYLPLLEAEVEKANLEVHFMSHYLHWSPQQNYYFVKENSQFQSNPEGRSEGTYSKYSSLDDKVDGQHYFTSLIKFGQGRAMNDACRDIRDGYISREEGVMLVKKYDEEFPKKNFEFFLDYIHIEKEQYWEVIDNARSPHLWIKKGTEWHLKHSCE
jgi:N-acetyl sugar amidotransferase